MTATDHIADASKMIKIPPFESTASGCYAERMEEALGIVRKPPPKPTSSKREAARRSRGRPVSTVLTDPVAISSLDALIAKLGGPKAAIEFALAEYTKSRT